jgi:transcriptional regulator with XRE-family HTH domain
MSADPLLRFLPAFGSLLIQRRVERNWTVEELAVALQSSVAEVKSMERGEYGPTLPEFFRIASALGEEPVILLIDLIAAWRADPTDYVLYKSRASDFSRLYRLGYYHDLVISGSTHHRTILLTMRHMRDGS